MDAFLDLIQRREVAEAWTTSDDADRTKPQPDLLESALQKLQQSDDPPAGDADVEVPARQSLAQFRGAEGHGEGAAPDDDGAVRGMRGYVVLLVTLVALESAEVDGSLDR